MRRALPLFLAFAAAACSSDPSPSAAADASAPPASDGATPPLSSPQKGIATYYAADGSGACSFDPSPNDLDVAAMNAPQFAGSAACGECVDVVGPKGKVTVRIVDLCPECASGHLDLSQQAFAKIADLSAGRVDITWTVVPCAVTGPVSYRFKEGSSKYWTAIQVRNHRLPIEKLEWRPGASASWQAIPRESYNYFVVGSGVGTDGAFEVRVTAAGGASLTDTLPGVTAGAVVSGNAQF